MNEPCKEETEKGIFQSPVGMCGGRHAGCDGFTLAIVWKTGDTSPLAYLIPAIFAELATATGFYYSKAKAENRIKLRKQYGPEIYNDTKEM